jgi:hypothetical protein
VNRFQILKGLPPPIKKKVTPQQNYYFYGVDWGPRPESTGIAICHKIGKNIVFNYVRLMSESNHENLRKCLDFFNNKFPMNLLTIDVGPDREDLTGFGYNRTRCTEEMVRDLMSAIINGHVSPPTIAIGLNHHIRDAMALAFQSIPVESWPFRDL